MINRRRAADEDTLPGIEITPSSVPPTSSKNRRQIAVVESKILRTSIAPSCEITPASDIILICQEVFIKLCKIIDFLIEKQYFAYPQNYLKKELEIKNDLDEILKYNNRIRDFLRYPDRIDLILRREASAQSARAIAEVAELILTLDQALGQLGCDALNFFDQEIQKCREMLKKINDKEDKDQDYDKIIGAYFLLLNQIPNSIFRKEKEAKTREKTWLERVNLFNKKNREGQQGTVVFEGFVSVIARKLLILKDETEQKLGPIHDTFAGC